MIEQADFASDILVSQPIYFVPEFEMKGSLSWRIFSGVLQVTHSHGASADTMYKYPIYWDADGAPFPSRCPKYLANCINNSVSLGRSRFSAKVTTLELVR